MLCMLAVLVVLAGLAGNSAQCQDRGGGSGVGAASRPYDAALHCYTGLSLDSEVTYRQTLHLGMLVPTVGAPLRQEGSRHHSPPC